MADKPTYKELEQRIKELEKEALERRLADEELRTREPFLLEQAGVGMVYFSPDGEILWINAISASHLACKPENAIGKTPFDFFEESTASEYVGIRKIIRPGVIKAICL